MRFFPERLPVGYVVVLFTVILCLGITAPVLGSGEGGPDSESAATDTELPLQTAAIGFDSEVTAASSETAIELTQQLRRVPDRKGIFEADHSYQLPPELRQFEVTVPSGATVVSLDGFIQTESPRTYRWDGTTTEPEMVYRVQGNRSIDQSGPIAGPGELLYADVGEWAVVSQPDTAHRWGWVRSDHVGFDRTVTVDGPGAVGDVMAYLGRYDSYTHRAHGQQFELIVPKRADLAERPGEIFESLSDASETLRVGSRDERVFMIATPTERVEWGVRGLQTGPSDLWVRDIERLGTANNVWIHEYVHSRQAYTSTSSLRWFTEASATYYAALLSLEQERISFSQFRDRLAIGTSERRFGNSILSDPGSWRSNANYHVGALVSGELDRQLRTASDGEQSLQELFRRLNAADGVVSGETLTDQLVAFGEKPVGAAGQRLTTTAERPAMWDESVYRTVFLGAPAPARITYGLSRTDPLTVGGPYRNSSLDPSNPPVFVPGERVSLGVDATNFGEQRGEYTATLIVNGQEIQRSSGQLTADDSDRLTFTYQFEQRGEYRLSVGDVELLASVREPATPTVESFGVNRTEIKPGESVELSALLSNPTDRPALTTLRFTRDGEPIDARPVRLDVDGSKTASTAVVLNESGTYVFGVGEQSAQTAVVTVVAPPPTAENTTGNDTDDGSEDGSNETVDGETDTGTDDAGIGFGIMAAVIAVLAVSYARFRD